MKKLFSIMAIAALVFVGSFNANAATSGKQLHAQSLFSAATITIIQDADETAVDDDVDDVSWHQNLKEEKKMNHHL